MANDVMTCNAKLKSFKHNCRQVVLPHGLSANRPSNQLSIICNLEKSIGYFFRSKQTRSSAFSSRQSGISWGSYMAKKKN